MHIALPGTHEVNVPNSPQFSGSITDVNWMRLSSTTIHDTQSLISHKTHTCILSRIRAMC